MFKKKIALAMVISVLASMAVSCGNDEGNSAEPSLPESSVADTTEAETEPETEPETEAETEAPTEEITTEPETEPETDDISEETADTMTIGELVVKINDRFGMGVGATFEENLETVQAWDIVDTDTEYDENAPITAEFLISSAMRATGFVDGTSSLDEIMECAVGYGVIETADISAVDVSKADEIVEKAHDAWLNPNFDTNISVVLADGVVNLLDVIPADEVTYTDSTNVSFPAEYADGLEAGTVVILPDDTIDGTAYKITAIIVTADVANLTITPAGFEEVYGSIISE